MKKSIFILIIATCLLNESPCQVQITVDVNKRDEPISRRLFGKFTEHLGKNVYQGAWAQIVVNPEFVPADYWPGQGERNVVMEELEEAEEIFQLKGLCKDADNGIAAFWMASEGTTGSLHKAGIRDYQWIKTGLTVGSIQTGIFPPLHRTCKYQVSLTSRSEQPTEVIMQVLSIEGVQLGEVSFLLTGDWSTVQKEIEIKPEGHEKGDALVLKLSVQPDSEVEFSRILMFPSDHLLGWETEVIEYLRSAKLSLLRYPGGNFASGYNWMDGVGPLDSRPVLPNPAWPIMEWNHVGNDEWIDFCHLTGAEPMICVNVGDGTPELAADWVRYCNDPPGTEMGTRRTRNGSPQPFNVKIWEVGNELSGSWQVGYTNGEGYAERYANFAPALLDADPDIELVANGQLRVIQKSEYIDRGEQSDWNKRLLERNGDLVRSISVHSLVGGFLREPADPVEVWKDLVAYADNYPEFLDELVSVPMRNAGIESKVAITELMDWPRHPSLPNVTSISGALWYSAIINTCIRSGGLVELVTHTALMNHGGGLRKERGIIYTEPVWWATHMYNSQKGTIPLGVSVKGPTFNSSGEYIIKRNNMPSVDAVALMETNGGSCSIFLCNRDTHSDMEVSLYLKGFVSEENVSMMSIHCGNLALRNSWDKPEIIKPVWSEMKSHNGKISCTLPPLSLTRLILTSKSVN